MTKSAEILVVDDVPANLEVLTDILSSVDYTVAAVTSGERALRRLKTYLPDLILLDIQMPGMDGFETCQEIKRNPATANIPVVFITATSDIGSVVRGFSVGAVDYITKPFQELELLTRVKTHLQLQKMHQTLEQQVEARTQELETALDQLKTSQLHLIQQEKMSALGGLVSGIAHEINNPITSVAVNTELLRVSLPKLIDYLQDYERHFPFLGTELEEMRRQLNIDFLLQDLPVMLDSMRIGCDRISKISHSLRTFARVDAESRVKANIHDGLESTLLLLKHRLKAKGLRPAIEIVRDYGQIPEIDCFPGQLNQVFMNILVNAIDMFDEQSSEHPYDVLETPIQRIIIRTQVNLAQEIEIYIGDNGQGMPSEVCAKIFERDFTTKAVGKGMGLGLSISRHVIVEKHRGTLEVKSEVGQGTEFYLRLPMEADAE